MLLMVKIGIGRGILHSLHRHAKSGNRYMEDYDNTKKSSYLLYQDENNLNGAMMQKLPVNNFFSIEDTSQFDEDFLKNYNEESNEGYFLEVDVQYLEKLHGLHNDLPFLPEKDKKLAASSYDKTEYYIHKKVKTSIKSWISFEKSSQID